MKRDPVRNPMMFAAPPASRRQGRKQMRRHMRRQARYMRGGFGPVRWLRALVLRVVRMAVAVVIVGVALAVMTHRGAAGTGHAPAVPHGSTATHAPAVKHVATRTH